MNANALIERIKLRRRPVAPPIPPPPPPLDTVAAMRFLDLVAAYDAARAAHEVAVGRGLAMAGALAYEESWSRLAPDAERNGLTTVGSNGYAWTPARTAVKDAGHALDAARREQAEAEAAEVLSRAARDESLAAVVAGLGDAEDAERFLALQVDLAGRAVASAQAAFTPAVARKKVACRQTRHPLRPEELAIAMDGAKLAAAEREVEAADTALKEARRGAREGVAARESLERAVEAALASEVARGPRRPSSDVEHP